MVSRHIQQQARRFVALLIKPLVRPGVTPNTLTVIGLLLSILTAVIIARGYLLAGGMLVVFAGIFDMFDGAVARIYHASTNFGAFLDSTLDRYSESIILLGLLVYTLQRPGLQDPFWPFAFEQPWMITLIFVAVVGSLMVSYTKARAEGLGLECKTGLLARPERVVILALGLLTNTTIWAIVLLAIFSQYTAIERIVHVWRITGQPMQALPITSETDVATVPRVGAQPETSDRIDRPFVSTVFAKSKGISATHQPAPTTTSGMNEGNDPSVLPMRTSVPPFNSGVHPKRK